MKLFTSSYSKGNLIDNPVKDNNDDNNNTNKIIIRIIYGILHGQMKDKIDKENVRRARKVPKMSITYIGTIKTMDRRKQELV